MVSQLIKQKMMREDFFQILKCKFPNGFIDLNYFFTDCKYPIIYIKEPTDNASRLTYDNGIITIEGFGDKLQKCVRLLKEYAITNQMDWIIQTDNTQLNLKETLTTSEKSKRVLQLLCGMHNLNGPLFRFDHDSLFDTQLAIDFENMKVMVKSEAEVLFTIENEEDIVRLNEFQSLHGLETTRIRNNILNIFKEHDPSAYLVESGFKLFDWKYTFIMKKTKNDSWRVAFFRTFNRDCIDTQVKLDDIEDKLYEKARSFAETERYHALFR